MSSFIEEKLRDLRSKYLQKSIRGAEAREAFTAGRADFVKNMLKGPMDGTDKDVRRTNLSVLYYDMWYTYYNRVNFAVAKTESKRSIALWDRVAAAADQTGMSDEEFLKAQFAFFHKAYGRAPTLAQLATKKAVERALEFEGAYGRIVGANKVLEADDSTIMKMSEQRMQDIQQAQSLSREDVYRKLVLTGVVLFPKEFLEADPTYAMVKSEG